MKVQRYRVLQDSLLCIEDSVLKTLKKRCQNSQMNERGGILLGKVTEDYSQFTITEVSEPSVEDSSGPLYFHRNQARAQKIINQRWKESDGEINYLGEWHTHPQINPIPSGIDYLLAWESVYKNVTEIDTIFMIIVGMTGNLYIGYQNRGMKKLERINIIPLR